MTRLSWAVLFALVACAVYIVFYRDAGYITKCGHIVSMGHGQLLPFPDKLVWMIATLGQLDGIHAPAFGVTFGNCTLHQNGIIIVPFKSFWRPWQLGRFIHQHGNMSLNFELGGTTILESVIVGQELNNRLLVTGRGDVLQYSPQQRIDSVLQEEEGYIRTEESSRLVFEKNARSGLTAGGTLGLLDMTPSNTTVTQRLVYMKRSGKIQFYNFPLTVSMRFILKDIQIPL